MFSLVKAAWCVILCGCSMAALADEILPRLSACEEISDNARRLACYDGLVQQLRKQAVQDLLNKSEPQLLSQPDPEVLGSSLQTPDDDALRLSVKSFVDMIKVAQLDEGGGIKILGWQQLDKNNYILWLKMRGRTGLTIQFYEKSPQQKVAVSVLEAVVMQGQQVDPGMFIMSIAAMGPE